LRGSRSGVASGTDYAYERKANFEEMGYVLPAKKTEYPYWVDEISGDQRMDDTFANKI